MAQENGLFSLQMKDVFKGFVIAFGTALFPSLYTLIFSGDHFPTWLEFRPYLAAAVSAGVTYIGKNYFSNNVGQIAKKDVPIKVVPADAVVIAPDKLTETVPLPYNKTDQP